MRSWLGTTDQKVRGSSPSGAQDYKASDLRKCGSDAFVFLSLVVGWVLGGCSCDERPLRPGGCRSVRVRLGGGSGRCPPVPECWDVVRREWGTAVAIRLDPGDRVVVCVPYGSWWVGPGR
ncbi:hypothetical protein GCM10009541_40720 [Micromonospora gifhornensis]